MSKKQNFDADADMEEAQESSLRRSLTSSVKISDVLAIALKNWYWIVVSVVCCLAVAWYMVSSTVPLYTQSMGVMIRDGVQGSGTGPASVDMRDLGLLGSNTILDDEMAALKSPDLMEQVVVKLGLSTSYSRPGTFHDEVLYGATVPVNVLFPDMDPKESASLRVIVDASGKVEVKNLRVNGEAYRVNPETPVEFGGAVNTPSGRIIIQKTPFLQEGQAYVVDVTRMPLRTATAIYSSKVSIDRSANKNSNVVDIVCVDANIQRADDVLTTLLKCYDQNWLRSRADVVTATNDFISERLAVVEQELSGVDNSISSFKSTNLLPDVAQTSSMYLQESNATSQQILNYNNQLQMARYLKNYISTEGKNQVLPVNTGIANTNIEGLVGQYNALVMQRNSYIGNTSESNPLIVDIDARLAALRRSILSSIDNTIVALTTTVSNLERNEQNANARVAASPRQAKYLLSAERKQKVQETLYLYLLQKREENELSQAWVAVNTRVVRRPSGAGAPTSPKAGEMYLIAFVIGLVIPFGTIYGLEASNTKVRGRRDLAGLSVPVVGEIPVYRREMKRKFFGLGKKQKRDSIPVEEEIVVQEGNRNLVNEAFRVLRTNINFITADAKPAVIMLTSFNPASGKTMVTLNLGVSLALKQGKVLLVDCDMRRASLSRFAGSPGKGLADYLAGTVRDVDQVICHDQVTKGLDILPSGSIPPNPTELLETQRFANLIEYLRTEYDFILIDCPPAEMMADAHIITPVVDRTLFVVRVGLFERPMLSELEMLYKEKRYPNMSIVLNASVTGTRYGYTYTYGYGYTKKAGNYDKYYK